MGGGKGLEQTGMICKIEQLHVLKISYIVPISDQTPVAFWQRCERRVTGASKPVCSFY